MPDADASDHPRLPGRFVQNVLQHRHVLALAGRRHRQSLNRLAEREGGTGPSGAVCRHRPVDVVAERSLSDSDGVFGFVAIVRAAFPQRGDVVIGQIHIVADVHGPNNNNNNYNKKLRGTGDSAALQKVISPLRSKQKEKAVRGQHRVQIPKGLLINRSADTCSQISAPAGQRTGTPADTADPVGHVH